MMQLISRKRQFMDHLLDLGVVSAEAVADLATFFGGGEVRVSPKNVGNER